MVTATSGAFMRLLTSFMTSALLDKCPTVRATAEDWKNRKSRAYTKKEVNMSIKMKTPKWRAEEENQHPLPTAKIYQQ